MNNYLEKEKNKRIFLYIGVVVALVIVFFATYTIVDNLAKDKNAEVEDGKSVYNPAKGLDDDFLIVLSGDGVESKFTVEDFKAEKEVQGTINDQTLVNFFEADGYELKALTNSEITFEKIEKGNLVPNKYYLGVKDDFLAIYKSDENGNPFIESQSDIYTGKTVLVLPLQTEEELKSFKFYYDTKEEAVEQLSGYMN